MSPSLGSILCVLLFIATVNSGEDPPAFSTCPSSTATAPADEQRDLTKLLQQVHDALRDFCTKLHEAESRETSGKGCAKNDRLASIKQQLVAARAAELQRQITQSRHRMLAADLRVTARQKEIDLLDDPALITEFITDKIEENPKLVEMQDYLADLTAHIEKEASVSKNSSGAVKRFQAEKEQLKSKIDQFKQQLHDKYVNEPESAAKRAELNRDLDIVKQEYMKLRADYERAKKEYDKFEAQVAKDFGNRPSTVTSHDVDGSAPLTFDAQRELVDVLRQINNELRALRIAIQDPGKASQPPTDAATASTTAMFAQLAMARLQELRAQAVQARNQMMASELDEMKLKKELESLSDLAKVEDSTELARKIDRTKGDLEIVRKDLATYRNDYERAMREGTDVESKIKELKGKSAEAESARRRAAEPRPSDPNAQVVDAIRDLRQEVQSLKREVEDLRGKVESQPKP